MECMSSFREKPPRAAAPHATAARGIFLDLSSANRLEKGRKNKLPTEYAYMRPCKPNKSYLTSQFIETLAELELIIGSFFDRVEDQNVVFWVWWDLMFIYGVELGDGLIA